MWNKLSDETLNGKTPTEAALGETPDISDLLQFTFNEKVYYHTPGASYPASGEELGNFVGIADSAGDELTILVLSKDNQILTRSVLRSPERTDTHNGTHNDTTEAAPERGLHTSHPKP